MADDSDDEQTKKQIETTVLEILKDADMNTITEGIVRKLASQRLDLDLSLPHRRRLVRSVVESFLISADAADASTDAPQQEQGPEVEEEVEEEAEEEDDKKKKKGKQKEFDDDGDVIVCHLNKKRRVTLQDFKGKTLVSIREFYEKDGKQLPTSKGISLTVEQWKAFKKAVPAIEEAIRKMEGAD